MRAKPCLYILRGVPLSTHGGAQTQTGADSDAEKPAPPDESDDNSSFPEFEFSEFPEFGCTDPELPPFSTISFLLCTWVDDIVLTGPAPTILNSVTRALHDRFPLSDGGALTHILGIQVLRDCNTNVFLAQRQYIEHILNRFNHTSCHADPLPFDPSAISTLTQRTDVAPPTEKARYAELIGSLIYLSTRTRPDIATAVGFLSRFTANPSAWTLCYSLIPPLNALPSINVPFDLDAFRSISIPLARPRSPSLDPDALRLTSIPTARA
ncbi:MAG: hypothetical protein BJ554DRAFT_2755 [Olpidium bornovanus]|uniref:Reverse transcriptase Ty1/copia-type domain-containing protein n=1 Tax=Olpidium bornovanus TaxID=278681 RepID=A0A8H7ZPZ5_9FUNG|nr:MAG: hypothetical protein BJ554DRAFT_2755 [Olpidium bornovanus]